MGGEVGRDGSWGEVVDEQKRVKWKGKGE